MSARKLALAVLVLAGPVSAQDWDQLGQGLELRAHAVLMRQVATVDGPSAFTTDGCSGGLSATWQGIAAYWPQFALDHKEHPPFEPCCVSHDRAYHNAGSALTASDSYQARLSADRVLQACVKDTGATRRGDLAALYGVTETQVVEAYELLAGSMYYSVRFGGGPCSGLNWRWGYGYEQCWSGH